MWELVTMKALTKFCADQFWTVSVAPIGLFPAKHTNDPRLRSRIDDTGYLATFHTADTITMAVRCMNALYRLQTLQSSALAQTTILAQTNHELVQMRDTQIQEFNEEVDQRDTQLDQFQD